MNTEKKLCIKFGMNANDFMNELAFSIEKLQIVHEYEPEEREKIKELLHYARVNAYALFDAYDKLQKENQQ
jgi:hypothetical protein